MAKEKEEKRERDYAKEIQDAVNTEKAIHERVGQANEDVQELKAYVEALEKKYEELEKASNERMNKLEHQTETEIRRLERTGADLARNREILEMKENALTRMLALERDARRAVYKLQKQTDIGPFQRLKEWIKNITEKIVDALTMPKAAKEFAKLPEEEKQRITNMAYLEAQKKSMEESIEQAKTTAMKQAIHEDPGRHVRNFDRMDNAEKDMVVMEKLMNLTLQSKQQIYDGIGLDGNTHVIRFDYRRDPIGDGHDQIIVSLQRAAVDVEGRPMLQDVDRVGNMRLDQGEAFRVQVEDGRIVWSDTARHQAERLLAVERANMEELHDNVKCPIHEMTGDLATTVSSIIQSDYARNMDRINENLQKLHEGKEAEPIQLKEKPQAKEAPQEAPGIRKEMEKVLKELHDEYRDNPGKDIHKRLGAYDVSIQESRDKESVAYRIDGRFAGTYAEHQGQKSFDRILDKIEGKSGSSLLENSINQRNGRGEYVVPDEKLTDRRMADAILFDLRHGSLASVDRMREVEENVEMTLSLKNIGLQLEKRIEALSPEEQENVKAALSERSSEFADSTLDKVVHEVMDSLGIEEPEKSVPEPNPYADRETGKPDIPYDPAKEAMAQESIDSLFGAEDVAPVMEETRDISEEEAMLAAGLISDDPMEYTQETLDMTAPAPQMESPIQEPVMEEPAAAPYVDTSYESPDAAAGYNLFNTGEPEVEVPQYRTALNVTPELTQSLRSAVEDLAAQYNDQPKNDKHAISMEVEGFTLSVNPSDSSHGRPYFMIDGQNVGKCDRTMNEEKFDRIMEKITGGESEPGHLENKIAQMRGEEWRVSDERLIRDEFSTTKNGGFNDFARAAMFDTLHDTDGLQARVESLAESHPEFEFDRALAASEMVALAEAKFPESEQFVQFYEEKFQPMLQVSDGPLQEVLQQANDGMTERYQAIETARQEREEYVPDVHFAIPGDPNTVFSHTDKDGILLNERDIPVFKVGSDRPLTVDDIQEPDTRRQFEDYRDNAERSSLHEFREDYIPEKVRDDIGFDDHDSRMDPGDRMNYEESLMDLD